MARTLFISRVTFRSVPTLRSAPTFPSVSNGRRHPFEVTSSPIVEASSGDTSRRKILPANAHTISLQAQHNHVVQPKYNAQRHFLPAVLLHHAPLRCAVVVRGADHYVDKNQGSSEINTLRQCGDFSVSPGFFKTPDLQCRGFASGEV